MDNRGTNSLGPPRGRGRPRGRPRLNQRPVLTPTPGHVYIADTQQADRQHMDDNISTGLPINLDTLYLFIYIITNLHFPLIKKH